MKNSQEERLKHNPFTAPEGYFEQLDEKIRQRISASPTIRRTHTTFQLASLVAGLILMIWLLMPAPKSSTAEEILSQINEEDIALYLEVHDALAQEDILSPAEEESALREGLQTDSL